MTDLTLEKTAYRKVTVLGNAYMGLGLLMIPTAIGSYLTGSLMSDIIAAHPIAFFLTELVMIFGLMFAVLKHANSGLGFALSLAFGFFMGALLGPSLDHYVTHFKNGSVLIAVAALGTAGIFGTLAAIVHVTKKDFSGLGSILYVSLWGLIIAGVLNLFFQSSLVAALTSGIGVAVFSGYILYDVSEALHGRNDNWILVSLGLYLNVINLFSNLLSLLMQFAGSSDD